MEWFSLAVILFLIMDPLGNVSSYLSLTKGMNPKQQRYIVIREMLIALAAMLVFNSIGEYLFEILHVSEKTVRLASGVILFLCAIKILFPTVDSPRNNLPEGEPFIVPLAIPLVAGPSLLATIMLFAHIEPNFSTMIYAILAAWIVSCLVLLNSNNLQKWLGTNGLIATERLMGMVLVLLSIQRFLEGVQLVVKSCKIT